MTNKPQTEEALKDSISEVQLDLIALDRACAYGLFTETPITNGIKAYLYHSAHETDFATKHVQETPEITHVLESCAKNADNCTRSVDPRLKHYEELVKALRDVVDSQADKNYCQLCGHHPNNHLAKCVVHKAYKTLKQIEDNNEATS